MTNLTMPSFSSISLANTKVKFTLFTFAFALALVLYWPGMNGTPIWDDMTFWFYDSVMDPNFPYTTILRTFAWPVSVSAQKFMFSLIGKNWWVYHTVNFVLHSFNSWLVYRFLLQLRIRRSFAFIGFLLFLIHPASVITVAWMIQFKTLICFTLSLGAIILFVRARRKRDYFVSAFLFFLSILSKSSSLPLPIVLIFLLGNKWKTKKIITVIPFFLISAYGGYQITHSKMARESIENAAAVTERGVTVGPHIELIPELSFTTERILNDPDFKNQQFTPPPDEPLVQSSEENMNKTEIGSSGTLETLSPIAAYGRLFLKTLHYYFWQSFLPVDNSPVKGLNPYPPGFSDYLHVVFIIVLSIICWSTPMFPILVSAHVFLLPYLGIIPAPYMNVTWVSDQHLYLALPCFILLLLGLLEKVKNRAIMIPFFVLILFFGYKTHQASSYYKSNLTFYEKSIDSNVNNIPLVYNLTIGYMASGNKKKAVELLEKTTSYAEENPHMRDNRFYPFIVQLYSQLLSPQPEK